MRSVGLLLPWLILFTACHSETKKERAARALREGKLSDSQTIQCFAESILDVEDASTEVGKDGRVAAKLVARGEDMSGMPASVIDTAQGGINNAMKVIQLTQLSHRLAALIDSGRSKKLGDLDVTLKVPECSGGKVIDWVDVYRFQLPTTRFKQFLAAEGLSGNLDSKCAAVEKTWRVEFDYFNQFVYKKDAR